MTSEVEEQFNRCTSRSSRMDDSVTAKPQAEPVDSSPNRNTFGDPDGKRTSPELHGTSATNTSSNTLPTIMWGMHTLVNSESDVKRAGCIGSPGRDSLLQTHQASRRRRRKQMVPPQKFPVPCGSPNETLYGLDLTDSENESVRTGSDVIESDEATAAADEESETRLGSTRALKRSRNGLICPCDEEEENDCKLLNTQYSSLIDEISRQAMDAVKHCITPTTLFTTDKTQSKIEPGDESKDKTDQIVERALEHLEPQIARLVGQSIRRSIQSIRSQMLTGLGVDENQPEPNGFEAPDKISPIDKYSAHRENTLGEMTGAKIAESSGFTIGRLSGEAHNRRSENTKNSTEYSPLRRTSPIKESDVEKNAENSRKNTDNLNKIHTDNPNCSLLSTTLLEINHTVPPSGNFPPLIPSLQFLNQWKFNMPSHQPGPPPPTTTTSCTLTTDSNQDPMGIVNTGSQINCYTNKSNQSGESPKTERQKAMTSNAGNTEGGFEVPNQNDPRSLKTSVSGHAADSSLYSGLESSANVASKSSTYPMQYSEHAANPMSNWRSTVPPTSMNQTGATTAAAAAAILTAFGLTNSPFWAARRTLPGDRGLPPWIPPYPPSLLHWATETFGSSGEMTNTTNSQPLPSLPPFPLVPPLSDTSSTLSLDLPGSTNHINLNTSEQTEALSLVVRGMRKDMENNLTSRSTRDVLNADLSNTATEGRFGSMLTYSPGTPLDYQASLLSRRKRTKVTDTRMSTRGSRAAHCVSPRANASFGMTGCNVFGLFKPVEDKSSPAKLTGAVNMLGGFPVSGAPFLGRMLKSDDADRQAGSMIPSPPNLSEVRMNSSSSSPSPNSIRLSGGSRDLTEGESGRMLFDRTTSASGFYSQNPISNVHTSLRHSVGSITNLMNKDGRNCDADTFEQVLAKTFHTNPIAKRSMDGTGKSSALHLSSLFDSNNGTNSSAQTVDPNYQPTHTSSLLLGRDPRSNPIQNLARNPGLDLPGLRGPLTPFGKPTTTSNDNLLKRGLHSSLLMSGTCCDSDGIGDSPNGTGCMDGMRTTSTLTPVHLRKAKLMFFYTRYPNSTLIKMYFPDVKFYKNNTAQLVKWFSNFREFYYIQMEKFARVAISEGVRSAEEIHVTTDSELYRALNLHYNRNQQLEVPEHFRIVVEATLREFFNALMTGKDAEQSWKKPIYKIIARMDQPVPEFFKNPNWMEQLADG